MKEKFTPGPWVINGNDVESDALDLHICHMHTRYDNTEHDKNLIACAPDMYEVLEQSKVMLENFHRNTGSLGAKAKAEEIESLLKRARGE